MRSSSPEASRRIAFLHPDLGIGGSERLVVDAAEHLQSAGHRVTIFTAHHDRAHCFAVTRDGTLDVRVHGDFLPSAVGGHLRAPSAIARMSFVAAAAVLRHGPFDLVFCDLVAHVVPLVRLLSRAPVVFYCHYPDRELAPQRAGLYRLYRAPIDRWEEMGTGMASAVLVNSRFTAEAFRRAFPHLRRTPDVLYPGVAMTPAGGARDAADPHHLLVFGRYGPEKNLPLAIAVLARLRDQLPAASAAALRLTIAGGFDPRLRESRDTLAGLERRVRELGIEAQVRLVLSPSDAERAALLAACGCVVHTAEGEHFGYVPLEAMAAARPVVAVDRGGPAETVVDGVTGFLRPPTAEAFAEALARLIGDRAGARRMGEAGRQRAAAHFSRNTFGARLEAIVAELTGREPRLVSTTPVE